MRQSDLSRLSKVEEIAEAGEKVAIRIIELVSGDTGEVGCTYKQLSPTEWSLSDGE